MMRAPGAVINGRRCGLRTAALARQHRARSGSAPVTMKRGNTEDDGAARSNAESRAHQRSCRPRPQVFTPRIATALARRQPTTTARGGGQRRPGRVHALMHAWRQRPLRLARRLSRSGRRSRPRSSRGAPGSRRVAQVRASARLDCAARALPRAGSRGSTCGIFGARMVGSPPTFAHHNIAASSVLAVRPMHRRRRGARRTMPRAGARARADAALDARVLAAVEAGAECARAVRVLTAHARGRRRARAAASTRRRRRSDGAAAGGAERRRARGSSRSRSRSTTTRPCARPSRSRRARDAARAEA